MRSSEESKRGGSHGIKQNTAAFWHFWRRPVEAFNKELMSISLYR